jgi:hypothetical protein
MSKPFILWSHPRSASSQFLEVYAKSNNLKVNLDEPIKKGCERLDDLLSKQASFKIMGYYSTEEIANQIINANYNNIVLFRKDIYRTYLSFSFSKLTDIWHINQINKGEKGDVDIVKAVVKAKLFHNVSTTVRDVKSYYEGLNNIYLHLDKTGVQFKLIETEQAIDYLGPIGYQDTDKHYCNLENSHAKDELESFIQTLEIYKNHDMQSTI